MCECDVLIEKAFGMEMSFKIYIAINKLTYLLTYSEKLSSSIQKCKNEHFIYRVHIIYLCLNYSITTCFTVNWL